MVVFINIVAKNGICPFYDKKCTIYNDRPNDCRLFPFDIKIIENKYFLILYKLDCFNFNDMIKENVDDIVELVKPYIDIFASKELNIKLDAMEYTIIKEIKI